VIVQGRLPTQAADLNWSPAARDRDELWNDCLLWHELQYNRPAVCLTDRFAGPII